MKGNENGVAHIILKPPAMYTVHSVSLAIPGRSQQNKSVDSGDGWADDNEDGDGGVELSIQ